MADEFDSEQVIREVTEALHRTHPERDPGEVERVVRSEVESLMDRPVRDYVSVLARRAAKKRLDADDA